MNIPNLDFEISLIKGFWNAPSKIDWYHSIPQEGTISIIVSVVLIIMAFIQYSGATMKFWKASVLLFSIPIFLPLYYYLMKLFLHFFIWMMEFPWYVGIFIIPLSAGILLIVVGVFLSRWIERKKSRKNIS